MSELQIEPVPAFRDNYLWLLYRDAGESAVVVDPGDDEPVVRRLEQLQRPLSAILITHHHPDHAGGVRALLRRFPEAAVYGPAGESIAGVRHRLHEGDRVYLETLDTEFTVLDVPGHTAGHIAYFAGAAPHPVLLCGDTLFAAGCGRLFEGTAEQLYGSLQKLAELPGDTRVYCAHEYTLNNIRFAREVEPDNLHLLDREFRANELRADKRPTLPSTLSEELHTNPFLRADRESVARSVEARAGHRLDGPAAVFAELRRWKDQF